MKPGSTCAKLSQIGVIPRPAGLGQAGRPTPAIFRRATLTNMALSTRLSSHQCGSGRIHKSRPKGLNQVELSPNPMTTQRFRTQLNLRSNVGLESNVPEKQKPKPSQSQAGRPRRGRPASNYHRWGYATSTDLRRRSRAFTQRRWPYGHIPRPAGIGGPAGPTWRPLKLSLGVKDKQNELTCVQSTLSPVPTLV